MVAKSIKPVHTVFMKLVQITKVIMTFIKLVIMTSIKDVFVTFITLVNTVEFKYTVEFMKSIVYTVEFMKSIVIKQHYYNWFSFGRADKKIFREFIGLY